MEPEDRVGRIHKDAFVITTGCGLALALLGATIRFLIRIRVQRQHITIDDGFLILAVILLITFSALMYEEVVGPMYLFAALQNGVEGVTIDNSDIVPMTYRYHKFTIVCGMLGWTSFNAVKFSFLFFFRKIIHHLRYWRMYWWFVVAYTSCLFVYGLLVYYLSCPYIDDPRIFQCNAGTEKNRNIIHSAVNIALDIVGDLLILAIPVLLIWTIRIQRVQKLILSCSLCLTIFIIGFSIIRAAGLVHNGAVDTTWAMFWHFIIAEVGVLVTSATAFRSFFVARKNSRQGTYDRRGRVDKADRVKGRPFRGWRDGTRGNGVDENGMGLEMEEGLYDADRDTMPLRPDIVLGKGSR
ncbi:uncharacterized protein KD926_004884 [Aspergillus affinis]|uniref:uncharacterized protein n=1 Tax=Aspergillus affinis TaxID=1070780 RepID=UPI0022FF0ED0|nr:uncharacterized protein KD926_004884 [Aspergillus affinis]KAI9042819.1 hypothetical protein KD926_004884 [Aspergillus affinis]